MQPYGEIGSIWLDTMSTSPILRVSIIEEVSMLLSLITSNVQKFIVRKGGGDRCFLGRVALMLHLSVKIAGQ